MLGAVAAMLLAATASHAAGDPVNGVLAFLGNPTIVQWGATSILAFGVFAILRGWLVPRAVLVDRMKDKDAQIQAIGAERDRWQKAYELSEEGRKGALEQNSELIRGGETSNRLMESMRNYLERSHPQRQIEVSDGKH